MFYVVEIHALFRDILTGPALTTFSRIRWKKQREERWTYAQGNSRTRLQSERYCRLPKATPFNCKRLIRTYKAS